MTRNLPGTASEARGAVWGKRPYARDPIASVQHRHDHPPTQVGGDPQGRSRRSAPVPTPQHRAPAATDNQGKHQVPVQAAMTVPRSDRNLTR